MSLIEVCIVTLIIICVTRMYCDGAWGGDQTLATLLNTTIYSYSETFRGWTRFGSYEMYGISSSPLMQSDHDPAIDAK